MTKMVAGIDACRGGWFVAVAEAGDRLRPMGRAVVKTFAEAVAFASSASAIAVDIPIGLMDRGFRACDLAARKLLGPRSMCVFKAPPRPVLSVSPYSKANKLYRALCGQGMSQQAFGIMPKIAEVDDYLRSHPGAQDRVFEVHPELCFRALNGGAPLLIGKNKPEGVQARRVLLRRLIPDLDRSVDAALAAQPHRVLKEDDVLDAFVACVTAATWAPEATISVADGERDDYGLPIQMRCPATTMGS